MSSVSFPRGTHPIRASIGAALAISLALFLAKFVFPSHAALPLLLASTGASAVLVMAVPASPLAQPWPVFGGSLLSGAIGIGVGKVAGDGWGAVGLAMGLALFAMHWLRCLHPPGGAVALAAIMGGPAVAKAGYAFLAVPLGLNVLILLGAGYVFNNLTGSHYPHRAERTAPQLPWMLEFDREDVEAVLEMLEDRPDVDPADLEFIIRAVEARVLARNGVQDAMRTSSPYRKISA